MASRHLERLERSLLRALSPLVRRINFRMGRYFLQGASDPLPAESAQWSGDIVDAPFAMAALARREIPPDFLARILAAYQSQAARRAYDTDSMWAAFFHAKHESLHAQLMASDAIAVEKAVTNPVESTLHYGFDCLFKDNMATLEASEDARIGYGVVCRAALVRIAESIGCLQRYHPATGNRTQVPAVAVDEILEALDDFLGFRLQIPNVYPNEPGIPTSRGVITYRALTSLYSICRTKSVLGSLRDCRILEIGAGLGRTAYFASLGGVRRYDIVDLPMTAVAQGNFLCQTLGPDRVILQGESPASPRAAMVKLLSPAEFLDGSERYDIAVNFDSLTEVGEDIARDYWRAIDTRTGAFFSVNHEANKFTIHSLLASSGSAWKVLRNPSWLYPGYVEETAWRHDHLSPVPAVPG